jgi:hypothetical protein
MPRVFTVAAATVIASVSLGCTDSTGPVPAAATYAKSDRGCPGGPYKIPLGGNHSPSNLGDLRKDGSGGTDVSCRVRAQSDSVTVFGQVEADDQSFLVKNGTLTGSAEQGYEGKADIAFYHPDVLNRVAGTGCSLSISTSQEVADGRVWSSFACANATIGSTQQTCDFSGSFAFENCD